VLNVELLFDLKKDQYLPISTESNDLGIKLKSNFGVKLEMDKSLNHQNPKCFTLSLKMVCDSPYFNADIWQQCWVHNLSWNVQNLSKSSHFLIDKFIWACAWPKSLKMQYSVSYSSNKWHGWGHSSWKVHSLCLYIAFLILQGSCSSKCSLPYQQGFIFKKNSEATTLASIHKRN
jgi:hypothetical protein